MSNKIPWQNYPEIIQYIAHEKSRGLSYVEISKSVRRKYGLDTTRHAIRNAHLYYATDDEYDGELTEDLILSRRRAQNSARSANRSVSLLSDLVLEKTAVLEALQDLVKDLNKSSYKVNVKSKTCRKGKPMTAELLFSDWQIGKTSENYNTQVAINRIKEYTSAAIFKINQHITSGYNIERIVLVLLGDIIESAEKALKKNSSRSVDCSTPIQLQLAIKHMFLDLLLPLAHLGIPIEVIGVPGNHDGVDNGMIDYRPGSEHLTWTIYKTLELLADQANIKSITFNVPEGYFATTEYYGCTALYEHGYTLSVSEASLNSRRNERMRQLRKYVHYFRMGDKHNISRFNDDTLVVNGAFFGTDKSGTEYASIHGYSNIASQLMFFHVPRKDERLSIFDSFSIQLGHIHA